MENETPTVVDFAALALAQKRDLCTSTRIRVTTEIGNVKGANRSLSHVVTVAPIQLPNARPNASSEEVGMISQWQNFHQTQIGGDPEAEDLATRLNASGQLHRAGRQNNTHARPLNQSHSRSLNVNYVRTRPRPLVPPGFPYPPPGMRPRNSQAEFQNSLRHVPQRPPPGLTLPTAPPPVPQFGKVPPLHAVISTSSRSRHGRNKRGKAPDVTAKLHYSIYHSGIRRVIKPPAAAELTKSSPPLVPIPDLHFNAGSLVQSASTFVAPQPRPSSGPRMPQPNLNPKPLGSKAPAMETSQLAEPKQFFHHAAVYVLPSSRFPSSHQSIASTNVAAPPFAPASIVHKEEEEQEDLINLDETDDDLICFDAKPFKRNASIEPSSSKSPSLFDSLDSFDCFEPLSPMLQPLQPKKVNIAVPIIAEPKPGRKPAPQGEALAKTVYLENGKVNPIAASKHAPTHVQEAALKAQGKLDKIHYGIKNIHPMLNNIKIKSNRDTEAQRKAQRALEIGVQGVDIEAVFNKPHAQCFITQSKSSSPLVSKEVTDVSLNSAWTNQSQECTLHPDLVEFESPVVMKPARNIRRYTSQTMVAIGMSNPQCLADAVFRRVAAEVMRKASSLSQRKDDDDEEEIFLKHSSARVTASTLADNSAGSVEVTKSAIAVSDVECEGRKSEELELKNLPELSEDDEASLEQRPISPKSVGGVDDSFIDRFRSIRISGKDQLLLDDNDDGDDINDSCDATAAVTADHTAVAVANPDGDDLGEEFYDASSDTFFDASESLDLLD